mmetsp:Transcript_23697/g.78462  ORF Transcript_23697/g.78462 Transcript_23697/m.78462 type:complete len:250 (-) Transcript_23697:277-1026(-)
MHAQVSHLMSCGLISGLPYLAERSMVILLRANAVLLRKNTRAMLSRSLRLIHQLSHNTLVHVADRLALGLLDLLRMKQWKLRLLVPLLAEADKHRKGQPYVAAAALAIVGDLPQAISFAKTWTTCRQLILGNIHRQLSLRNRLISADDESAITGSLCGVQQLLVAMLNRYKAARLNFDAQTNEALIKDMAEIWAIFSRSTEAVNSTSQGILNEMANNTRLLLQASSIIETTSISTALGSNEPKERTYIV